MKIEIIENIKSMLPVYYINNDRTLEIFNNDLITRVIDPKSYFYEASLKENYIENGELNEGDTCYEGAKKTITVNSYERDPKLREACIKEKGTVCMICGCDFGKKYGERGEGFIEIHHRVPLYRIGHKCKVRLNDLVPICSNCHSMLHRHHDEMTVEELKEIYKLNNNEE